MSDQLMFIENMIKSKKNILSFIDTTIFQLDYKESWNKIYKIEEKKILLLERRKNRLLGIIKE